MRKYTKNIFLLITICIIIFYFILKDNFNQIIDLLFNSNKLYFLMAILFVLISDLFKAGSVLKLVKSLKFKYKFKNAISLMLMSNFFNGITPFALGGQPFELYILKKDNNVDYANGTNILFRDFYTYQMALMFLGTIITLGIYSFNVIMLPNILEKVLWFGLAINVVICLFLIYVPHSKTKEYKVINFALGILYKVKIIKNKNKLGNRVNEFINRFKVQTKSAIKDKKTIIACVILNCLRLISLGIATYFCFISIGAKIELLKPTIIYTLIIITAAFVPIPGASGGMEFSFMQLFSSYVIEPKLKAALLLWRLSTYYIPMIFGSIILVFKRKQINIETKKEKTI